MPVKKIRTEDVEVGMYVSSLDRPWSETPFLFQGFPVREKAEIEELEKLCRHVYIMVPDEEIELSGRSSRRKPEAAYSDLIGRKRYEITKSSSATSPRTNPARLIATSSDANATRSPNRPRRKSMRCADPTRKSRF